MSKPHKYYTHFSLRKLLLLFLLLFLRSLGRSLASLLQHVRFKLILKIWTCSFSFCIYLNNLFILDQSIIWMCVYIVCVNFALIKLRFVMICLSFSSSFYLTFYSYWILRIGRNSIALVCFSLWFILCWTKSRRERTMALELNQLALVTQSVQLRNYLVRRMNFSLCKLGHYLCGQNLFEIQ